MTVYLLHFDRPYKHAAHYTGSATHIKRRLAHHAAGTGARLLQVVAEYGIAWSVARMWRNRGKRFERRLKKRDYGPIAGVCPICCGKRRRMRTLRRELLRRRRCGVNSRTTKRRVAFQKFTGR